MSRSEDEILLQDEPLQALSSEDYELLWEQEQRNLPGLLYLTQPLSYE